MKRIFGAVAVAATFLISGAASAQTPIDNSVTLHVKTFPFATPVSGYLPATGGGHLADFAVDFPPSNTTTFTDYLIWCIDGDRPISNGGVYNYSVFDVPNFSAAAPFTPTPSVTTMNQIISLVNTLSTGFMGFTAQERADYQGSIWALFRGDAGKVIYAGDASFNTGGWYVLSSNEGSQTFVFKVDEPSNALLATLAMGGVILMYRRRRNA